MHARFLDKTLACLFPLDRCRGQCGTYDMRRRRECIVETPIPSLRLVMLDGRSLSPENVADVACCAPWPPPAPGRICMDSYMQSSALRMHCKCGDDARHAT